MDITFTIIKNSHRLFLKHLNYCILLLLITVFPFITYANSTLEYNLFKVANLQHKTVTTKNWLGLIANPSDKEQLYLANKNGEIYLVEDGEITTPALLDLSNSEYINSTTSKTKKTPLIELTAFVLHPGFTFSEQTGFSTFYTAHTEISSPISKTKRLQVRKQGIKYTRDSVITEWRLSPNTTQHIKIASHREILRLSLVDNQKGINQLSFHPFQKSWNDDYGLLYFSVPEEASLKQFPLYSGAILRINPESYGRKTYTIPLDNPYRKEITINDEIILLGGQAVEQFLWPQKNNDQLLISHTYNNQHLLSFAELRNDWRQQPPKDTIELNTIPNGLLLYQGRDLSLLLKRLVYISKNEQNWQLNSLTITKDKVLDNTADWKFPANVLPTSHVIKIFEGHANELLFLDPNNDVIFQASENSSLNQDYKVKQTPKSNNNFIAFIILLIVIATGIILFILKLTKSKQSLITLVKRNFAYYEVNHDKTHVSLYSRHKTMTEVTLAIADIDSCEIRLNDKVIFSIDKVKNEGFSDQQEAEIRHYFSKEYIDKMIDNKIRQVSLILTDEKSTYPISIYARRGNKRLTQKRYKDVMEELIDWCWLLASTINKSTTGVRKPRQALKSTVKAIKPINPLEQSKHASIETAKVMSPTNKASETVTSIVVDGDGETSFNNPIEQSQLAQQTHIQSHTEDASKTVYSSAQEQSSTNRQDGIIDTELVNALEKLVKLKQQGFLTDEEFNQAKEKLLKNLIK